MKTNDTVYTSIGVRVFRYFMLMVILPTLLLGIAQSYFSTAQLNQLR